MALVKRITSRNKSCYILQANEQTFLLEYPSSICGMCFSFPSFTKGPKPLKLILPKFVDDIDYILVSRSDSLGVLFLEKDVPIYITEPVFEQILIKYRNLLRLSIHYEDEEEHGISIENADIERFKRNARFIKFNEKCHFDDVLITPRPAGTFIGWTNYLIELNNRRTIYYLSSLASKPRLSQEPGSISSDYLIINTDKPPSSHNIEEFSAYVNNLGFDVAIIPLEMTTMLIEVLLHILFVAQEKGVTPVYIVSAEFNRFHTIISIENEWLSKAFSSIKDPFPVRSYRSLHIVDTIDEISEITGPAIVFCDPLEFSLYPHPIFDTQKVISINGAMPSADAYYNLKLELDFSEISSIHTGTIIYNPNPGEYLYIESASNYHYLTVNGSDIQVYGNEIYLNGRLKFSDKHGFRKKMTFNQKRCKLSELFTSNTFFYNKGSYYFPQKAIKVTIENNRATMERIDKQRKSKESFK
ncbi:putative beta-lactamase-like protein [Encephalitozoon hellem]|nr:putative beta-lactamase-like protein [Encephalitozoon hellem]